MHKWLTKKIVCSNDNKTNMLVNSFDTALKFMSTMIVSGEHRVETVAEKTNSPPGFSLLRGAVQKINLHS